MKALWSSCMEAGVCPTSHQSKQPSQHSQHCYWPSQSSLSCPHCHSNNPHPAQKKEPCAVRGYKDLAKKYILFQQKFVKWSRPNSSESSDLSTQIKVQREVVRQLLLYAQSTKDNCMLSFVVVLAAKVVQVVLSCFNYNCVIPLQQLLWMQSFSFTN